MKKTITTIALLAVLGTLAVSCQKGLNYESL